MSTLLQDIVAVLIALAMTAWFSYKIGTYVGYESACTSVKMEWVKDKCMKVTREEVK